MRRRFLNYGMVGGGQGAFIGDVHRKAAAFDGICRLAAGSFSRDYENTLQTGEQLGLSQDRCYRTFEEMAERDAVCMSEAKNFVARPMLDLSGNRAQARRLSTRTDPRAKSCAGVGCPARCLVR